jgi:hypothetical protein
MDWSSVDWDALARLREVFLGRATAAGGPYWTDARLLESYDFTFGRRIAWKWAAMLEPLLARGWTPPAGTLVDWGCGTAIAARSLLAHAGPGAFTEVILWDHAPAATAFAERTLRERHPQVRVSVLEPTGAIADRSFVLVVSHVLNELEPAGREVLLDLARRAAAVLWVEPGTHADSRRLIDVREALRGSLHCWAPCPHDGRCGMLVEDNQRHWCHHFARPPTEAFTESGWSAFGRLLGIDLRSLAYSHLVLDRRAPAGRDPRLVRVIGQPRRSSAVMRILRCRADGVAEAELVRRRDPPLWRELDRGRHDGFLIWEETQGRIGR